MKSENFSSSVAEKNLLCCCEYLNLKQERSHILGCCCDCQEIDDGVERLISGRHSQSKYSICSIIKDRLRIPWIGGAKQIYLDDILPIFIVPTLAYVAAQNVWCSIFVFVVMSLVLIYLHQTLLKFNPQTKFFVMWSLTSAILVLSVFELKVVPLLEILPTENLMLFCLLGLSAFFAYKVKKNCFSNQINLEKKNNTSWSDFTEMECSICQKNFPPRTYHCKICQTCIPRMDHHCMWLDCCIGEKNHAFFLMSIIFLICALVYGSNLILTTVCQPFLFMNVLLLPEDCSDVYHEFDIAICFVSALYCLVLAVLLVLKLLRQCWLVSVGLTSREWCIYKREKRICFCFVKNTYNNGFLKNWSDFCLGCSK